MIKNLNVEKNYLEIIKKIESVGHKAYLVGGYVRDLILGNPTADCDVCTDADVRAIKKIFPRHISIGEKHGTITVFWNAQWVEITQFRVDGKYSNNRHPDEVIFTRSLNKDLQRRDFTINAMAYSPAEGLIDLFGGISDLNEKIIRCVGNPEIRFQEDALRILRAVRFASKLDFEIEENTYMAIWEKRNLLQNISVERITDEILKILRYPQKIELLLQTGILEIIFGLKNTQHNTDYNFKLTKLMSDDLTLVLVSFIYELSIYYSKNIKSISSIILNTLVLDKKLKSRVMLLVDNLDVYLFLSLTNIKKMISKIGYENLEMLFKIRSAIDQIYCNNFEKNRINTINKITKWIKKYNQPISIQELQISGNDLKKIGYYGPQIGLILSSLLDYVIYLPEHNNKSTLQSLLGEKI